MTMKTFLLGTIKPLSFKASKKYPLPSKHLGKIYPHQHKTNHFLQTNIMQDYNFF